MSKVIAMDGVTRRFGSQIAVSNLSLDINRQEIVGLLGPNGSGKTTTIRLLNGVIRPDKGSILVNGKDPITQGEQVRQECGVLTESAGLYERMSAEDNLRFFASLYDIPEGKARVEELLKDFGLWSYKDKLVGAYSTGMKKRLGIARALLHRPAILFLDEPTNGLDPEGARDLLAYITNLNQQYGVTILLCTHLLRQVQDLCHRFIFIHEGKLLEEGTLSQLEEKHLGPVKVGVETDLVVATNKYKHYPILEKDTRKLVFQLGDKQQISSLLKDILSEANVYSVTILGRDLESLYFKVRGKDHE